MIIKFCETFLLEIRQEKNALENRLCKGPISGWDDVKDLRGEIRGLEKCEQKAIELYKRMFNSKRLAAVAERSEDERNSI